MTASPFYFIGIGGQARSGKDTLGSYLLQRLNGIGELGRWERHGFAEPVKHIFMDVFDVDANFVETWKTLAQPPPGFQLPVRSCLTLIGDGFREMKPSVWIDKLFRDVKTHLIITDVRYLNEVETIRRRAGAVILLYRPGFANDIPGPSEQELTPLIRRLLDLGIEGPIRESDIPCDYFLVNRGAIEDLHRKAEEYILPDLVPRIRKILTGR